jgi:hypothetical protein
MRLAVYEVRNSLKEGVVGRGFDAASVWIEGAAKNGLKGTNNYVLYIGSQFLRNVYCC